MYNKESGYGRLIAQALSGVAPASPLARLFIVGATTLTNRAFVEQIFKHDATGIARVHATIALALAQCTASQGDVILVLPGHTEAIGNATALAVNVAGVRIVGLGQGNLRATLTLGTAITANIPITAANTSLENLIIDMTGFDTITSGITITAAGVTIRGCKFITANATNQVAIGITTSALATQFTFDGNQVVGTTDAGTTNFLQLVGGDDAVITNNYFYGAYTTSLGPINQITTAGLRMLIANNTLMNVTASSTSVIVLVSTSTGMIRDNRIAIRSGTAPITGAAMDVGGNYYKAAAGVAAGTLL